MATRCISSHLMTPLLSWRNPQGNEENWFGHRGRQQIENRCIHAGKVVVTEIGLAALFVTSTVETAAYLGLAVLSLVVYPFTDEPYKFFGRLIDSSTFTLLWSGGDFFFYNPIFVNVMTHESYARFWVNMVIPGFMRIEDIISIGALARRHPDDNEVDNLLAPILVQGRAIAELIDEGAHFIQEYVLNGASEETLELFKQADHSLSSFIPTKAIYIYAFGSHKQEEIPDFFKASTKNFILDLRRVRLYVSGVNKDDEVPDFFNRFTKNLILHLRLNPNKDILGELENQLSNPTKFEIQVEDKAVKYLFVRLKGLASEETQGRGSLFTSACWPQAIRQLSEPVPDST